MIKSFRKILLCLFCLSFFISCTTQGKEESVARPPENPNQNLNQNPNQNRSKKERIEALGKSVFCISIIIKGRNFENKYAVGTGFLVGSGWLASAEHVQIKAGQLAKDLNKNTYELVAWKEFENGDYLQFPIELFVSDKNTDMAIFRFDDKDLKTNPKFSGIKSLALAENLPPLGEEVVAIGYYGDYKFPFNSIGNVSMIDKNEDIVSDVTIMPGNSGAPVCSLETGEVLGITVSVLDLGNETVRFGIAKRATKMRELLEKLEKKN